ncbi:restriction endonuclease [Dehalococcoidia bacterium]|nr:restriction endonuclease [Dehalococcoidia bacterium]
MAKGDTPGKGHGFEKKVAVWAKRFFKASEVKTRVLFQGKTAARPYEIDVWVKREGGLLESSEILFIECKDRAGSIKRADITKFLASAEDIKAAVSTVSIFGTNDDRYWDSLAIVSTSEFDADALRVAKENEVGCYYYDGKRYIEKNKVAF